MTYFPWAIYRKYPTFMSKIRYSSRPSWPKNTFPSSVSFFSFLHFDWLTDLCCIVCFLLLLLLLFVCLFYFVFLHFYFIPVFKEGDRQIDRSRTYWKGNRGRKKYHHSQRQNTFYFELSANRKLYSNIKALCIYTNRACLHFDFGSLRREQTMLMSNRSSTSLHGRLLS